VRRRAEAVLVHLMNAAPPLHRNAAEVMTLAALRYDVLGRRRADRRRGTQLLRRRGAHAPAHEDGIVERGLNVAKVSVFGRCAMR